MYIRTKVIFLHLKAGTQDVRLERVQAIHNKLR